MEVFNVYVLKFGLEKYVMLMLMNVRMIFVCMEIVLIMMDIFFVCVLWGGLVYIVMLMWMNVLVVYV